VAAALAAASLAACGGGASDAAAPTETGNAVRVRALSIVGPPGPCEVSNPVLANIDFSQSGWTGDNTPSDPIAVNTLVKASVAYTDTPTDIHTAQWTWGDGTTGPADSITEADGAGVATGSHAYPTSGVFTVAATVSDACASSTVTRQVVVYDPSAGFVTGGGWITSPVGAYVAAPALTGRANFGFVSKYLKGATVPSGETEFQFQAASLNFHSESYEWLVVAGARAQYKGTGSINGHSGFNFMLTAVDGALIAGGAGADRFRIRIWHADASNNEVVDYDNQVDHSQEGGNNEGTEIGGGSIVIHKG
jgi:hypothetical protein